MAKYDAQEVPRADPRNSHSMIVDMVGPDRRVLDVGCATGYVARALAAAGCVVTGIDNDASAIELAADVLQRSIVADLETVDLTAEIGDEQFDAVIFGDVLEHLREPSALLRQAQELLAPGGFIVASIPNVTHGDVRLALLAGMWDYRELGLLDSTHLRFFSYAGVERMFADAGLVVLETRRVPMPLFASEIGVHEGDFPTAVIDEVRSSPDHDVYQFVVRGVRADAEGVVAAVAAANRDGLVRQQLLTADLELVRAQLAALAVDRDALAETAAALRVELAAQLRDNAILRATRTFRYTATARAAYGRVRGS